MATGWVKSLHCKSKSLEDVYLPKPISKPSPSKKPPLPLTCANSSQALKDDVLLFPKHPSLPEKPKPKTRSKAKPKPKPKRVSSPAPTLPEPATSRSFPTLTELPERHSSRRVVEIIFTSSWSHPFPGEIEMLFRVHNTPRTVARFEEYRTAIRSRAAASDDARCAVDGNEMMRFSSTGGDAIYDTRVVCAFSSSGGSKVEGISTFSGSSGAHESGGGGAGRRAMLVCRVIAGRVRTESDPELGSEGGFESVCGRQGELLVFDPRAVLPCFLIIYKV